MDQKIFLFEGDPAVGKEVGGNGVRKVDHGLRAPEILAHEEGPALLPHQDGKIPALRLFGFYGGPSPAVVREHRGIRASEPVDRLLDIPHHEAVRFRRDGAENPVLHVVRVLEFVDEEVF